MWAQMYGAQVEREIRLHSQLRHENIIQLYGSFEDEDNVYLVQEYAEGKLGNNIQRLLYCNP